MPKSSTAYAYAPLEADETSTDPDFTLALQETLAILADLDTYLSSDTQIYEIDPTTRGIGRSWSVGPVPR
jgi:hypothetical protein